MLGLIQGRRRGKGPANIDAESWRRDENSNSNSIEEAESFSENGEEPDRGKSSRSEEAAETFEDSSSLSEGNRGDVTSHASCNPVSPFHPAQEVATSPNHISDRNGDLSIRRQQLTRHTVDSDDEELDRAEFDATGP